MEELFRLPATNNATRWIDGSKESGKFYLAINPMTEEPIRWEEILKETAIALCAEMYIGGSMCQTSIKRCQAAGLLPGDRLQDTGDRLILLRKRKGLTQKQLADLLSLPEQSIQRYEKEGYQGATLKRLQEIEKVLDN
jgi:DNA-binding XRE family transcriptional regulator